MILFSNKKGFTLIELLVVITLIAILAVAVLAAINPIEQRRKAQDTGVAAAGSQIVAAFERFYTTYGCYPVHSTTAAGGIVTCGAQAFPVAAADIVAADVTELVTTGELKDASALTRITNVVTAAANRAISIDANRLVHFCFVPISNAFRGQASRTNVGAAGGTFYCIPDSQ